jgi:REase_MTES_1575/Transcriptional regulator, AbiEi antitoxin
MVEVGCKAFDSSTKCSPRPRDASFDARLSVDHAIASLAERQHGVVGLRQLRALGMTDSAVRYRIAVGRLHRSHVGVYAVGHWWLSANGRRMAAVLACGPEAVLSHRDAAALWGLRPSSRRRTDVTAARQMRSRPGIDVHRVRSLHADDRTKEQGIPVTRDARTLLDLADVVRRSDLRRAFEEADRRRLLDLFAVEALLHRSPGRHGLKALRALVDDASASATDTQSELEAAFLRFCAHHAIPPPATNVQVAGFTVDAVWPAQQLIVELDGYAFHGTRAAFERDRARDAELQRAGYRVVRLTWRRLHREPAAVAASLHGMLASIARPWRTA